MRHDERSALHFAELLVAHVDVDVSSCASVVAYRKLPNTMALRYVATLLIISVVCAQNCANMPVGPAVPLKLAGNWIGPFDVPSLGVSGVTLLTLPVNASYVLFTPQSVSINGQPQTGFTLPQTWDCVNAAPTSVSCDGVTGACNISCTDANPVPLLQRSRYQCLTFFLNSTLTNGAPTLVSAQYNGSQCVQSMPAPGTPLYDIVTYTAYSGAIRPIMVSLVRVLTCPYRSCSWYWR